MVRKLSPWSGWRHAISALLLTLVLSGCASQPLQHRSLDAETHGLAPNTELRDVPFHPQQAFHCGPASLAMLLNWQGDPAEPDELAPRVYLEGRQGSLQAEMLATARRQGLLAYVHEPGFEPLLRQLDAGHPVVVLKNLGFRRYPIWHYAVVIGYDLDARQVIMRSGTTERKTLSFRRFERRWQGGDYWAMTLHRPGEFPADASGPRYLRAGADLEQVGRLPEAMEAYRATTHRWPDAALAWMALGNGHYRQGEYLAAETAYRTALSLEPDRAAAHHNLAWALLKQQRPDEALPHALRAHRLAADQGAHYRGAMEALLEESAPRN